MFTCENCLREKPDNQRVTFSRFKSFVFGLMMPLGGAVVCRRCARRVQKLGIMVLVGLFVSSLITLLVLDFAAYML
jgi:hypothetical protein